MRRGLIRIIVIVVVALLLALLFVFLLSGRVNAAGGATWHPQGAPLLCYVGIVFHRPS